VNHIIELDGVTVLWNAAKKEVSTGPSAGLGCKEILRIRVYIENHVGGRISNLGIRMCPHVIKELVDSFVGVFGGGRLLCGNI
jgi:hypothetical protein